MTASNLGHAASDNSRADFLDRTIPLDGASHAEVVEYSVDIPLRYAECFARLTDGRIVRLLDSCQFIGWSGWSGPRSFLFRNGRRRIEIQMETGDSAETKRPAQRARKFITRDGTRLVIRRWAQLFVKRLGHRRPQQVIDMPDLPAWPEASAYSFVSVMGRSSSVF